MRRALVLVCGMAGVLFLWSSAPADGRAAPEPARFTVSVTATGESPPSRLWVEQGAERINLTLSNGVYEGSAPASGIVTVRQAKLIAEYGANLVTLPVRFVPQRPAMRLSIQNPPLISCADPEVVLIESPGGGYAEQLRAYYRARRLARSGTCGGVMQPRVVKAWFDRSYALANSNDHIALDSEAAEALKRIPVHRSYAVAMEQRMNARSVQLDYLFQQALAASGDYQTAVAVNAEISDNLEQDPVLAVAVAQYQDLTISQVAARSVALAAQAARVE